MELKCNWCLASLSIIPLAIAYPCGHRICRRCYSGYKSDWCVVCVSKWSKSQAAGGIPETHSSKHHPQAPSHPTRQPPVSPQTSPQRQQPQTPPHPTQETHVTLRINPEPSVSWPSKPHFQAEVNNVTSTKPPSPSQPCTPQEARLSSPAARWDSCQDARGGTESSSSITQRPHRLLDSEEPRAAQIPSVHTSSHQETLSRNDDTQLLKTLTNTPSPQHKKSFTLKGPQPYRKVTTRDLYLTSPRKESSPPSRTTDPAHPRTIDAASSQPSPTSCFPFLPDTGAMSPSGLTESPHHAGKDAKYSPRDTGGSDEATSPFATTREPQLKQPLIPFTTKGYALSRSHKAITGTIPITAMSGRAAMEDIVNGDAGCVAAVDPQHGSNNLGSAPRSPSRPSSPSQEVRRPCERCEEERRRHLEEQGQWRKEEERLHGEVRLQRGKKRELQGEVTQLIEAGRRQEEELKRQQELQSSTYESLLKEIETLKQTNETLVEEFNLKNEEIERRNDECGWLKTKHEQQERKILALKEKVGQSADHKHEALLQELTSLKEQMKMLTQEKSELREEVTSLREAKDAHEGEAMYWKEEYDKQQKAKQEEMGQFKLEELNRLQRHYVRWEGKVKEMQNRVVDKDGQIKQLIDKNNTQQNMLQQTEENLVKCKTDAAQMKKDKEFFQKESEKWEEEVKHLKQELSEWEKVVNWQKDELRELEGKAYTQDSRISDLMNKDKQNQEDIQCLIRERDTCQEEVKELKGVNAKLKEKMEQLRREWDDSKLKIHQLENKTPELGIKFPEAVNTLIIESDELRRKNCTQQEEATQLRQERDEYKEEIEELRGREKELTLVKAEMDRYKEKVDKLKNKKDRYKEELNKVNNKITELEQERNDLQKKLDDFKWRRSRVVTSLERKEEDYKEEIGELKKTKATLENQLRERDHYREELEELKTREAKVNQILQMTVEKKDREEMEGRKIVQLEEEVHSYKEEIKNHLAKEETLEQNLKQVKIERENDTKNMNTKIAQMSREIGHHKEQAEEHKMRVSTLERDIKELKIKMENDQKGTAQQIKQLLQEIKDYKGRVEDHRRREATMGNLIEQVKKEKENQQKETDREIAKLWQERGNWKGEIEHLKKREDTLKKQLRDAEKEKNSIKTDLQTCKRENDSNKQKVQRLTTRESVLENEVTQLRVEKSNYQSERDTYMRERDYYKRERNNYQEEVEKLKRRSGGEIVQRETRRDNHDRDQHRREAEHLRRQHEVAEGKAEVEQLKRRSGGEIVQRETRRDNQDRDQHRHEAEHLRRQQEVAEGKAEVEQLKRRSGGEIVQRETRRDNQDRDQHLRRQQEAAEGKAEVPHTKQDLAAIGTPPAHWQQQTEGMTKSVEVVTVGPPVEEEEMVETQGLPNLGNSCYINSVVQCLYHLPPLRNTLTNLGSPLQHDRAGTGVALALAQLFGAMRNGSDYIHPAAEYFKGVLGSHDESFGGNQQQEVHDLFSSLASWLQSDLSQHDGPAAALFDGLKETKIVCQKSRLPLTNTSEPFTSLSLPVMEHRQLSLEGLIYKHFMKQSLLWDCERCRSSHMCDHLTHIRHCPPVLVIHFSRIAEFGNTHKIKVEFPVKGLSLQQYMAPDAPLSPQYQLVGVVCHEGSMSYGHYTAYCRYGTGQRAGKWRLCNDAWVRNVSEREVLQDQNAHMLFYIRQEQ